jgi:DmsE family decaheme c-type cytochrome
MNRPTFHFFLATLTSVLMLAIAVVSARGPDGGSLHVRAGLTSTPLAGGSGLESRPASLRAQDQPAAQAGYVGAETCLGCHDNKANMGAHGRVVDPRTPMATLGCETCHGPGQAHVDGLGDTALIRNPAKLTPAEVSETCTSCHNRGEHAFWEGSQHEGRDVSCTTCHSMHSPKSETMQLVASDVRGVCATCHRDKIAKLDRSGHMPVREGKMECTTCHNPHGSSNVRLLRRGDSIGEMCASCHADKRGPFLWEHPPARDGCTTCHDPHGSSNERMLVSRTPILCQRCHVQTRHPSTIYDAGAIGTSARVYARSCVTCHTAIHGSNHPSGQRFLR